MIVWMYQDSRTMILVNIEAYTVSRPSEIRGFATAPRGDTIRIIRFRRDSILRPFQFEEDLLDVLILAHAVRVVYI